MPYLVLTNKTLRQSIHIRGVILDSTFRWVSVDTHAVESFLKCIREVKLRVPLFDLMHFKKLFYESTL